MEARTEVCYQALNGLQCLRSFEDINTNEENNFISKTIILRQIYHAYKREYKYQNILKSHFSGIYCCFDRHLKITKSLRNTGFWKKQQVADERKYKLRTIKLINQEYLVTKLIKGKIPVLSVILYNTKSVFERNQFLEDDL